MIHNRKQTIKILKFAKDFEWTVEAALIIKGIPMKVVKENSSFKFLYNEKAKQNL